MTGAFCGRSAAEAGSRWCCATAARLWDMFEPLAPGVAGVATVVRWDQRGCGRSQRHGPYTLARFLADLDMVCDRLGGRAVRLLGHSWGATLALLYALRHPDRVSKLIYVSGTGIDPGSTWKPAYEDNLRRGLGSHLPRWEELASRARTPGRGQAVCRVAVVGRLHRPGYRLLALK
jgi:proline iminopeptidase